MKTKASERRSVWFEVDEGSGPLAATWNFLTLERAERFARSIEARGGTAVVLSAEESMAHFLDCLEDSGVLAAAGIGKEDYDG